ncbi:MAG: hypothetical protein ACRCW1_05100 [Anaerotignaceae bacterium]
MRTIEIGTKVKFNDNIIAFIHDSDIPLYRAQMYLKWYEAKNEMCVIDMFKHNNDFVCNVDGNAIPVHCLETI